MSIFDTEEMADMATGASARKAVVSSPAPAKKASGGKPKSPSKTVKGRKGPVPVGTDAPIRRPIDRTDGVVRVNIPLSSAVHARLRLECVGRGKTMGQAIEEALEAWFD